MIDHNALIEDIQQLATTLESSHPDPYTKAGARSPSIEDSIA
jgi:hypothetical protein